MTYPQTIDYLLGIRLFGQKLGLETTRDLLRRMGDPQRSLRFLHIAGTNGKGSVAAMAHAVLKTAGYKTGLYTSPHLVSFCERFQVNGQPIAESDVVRLVGRIRPLLDEMAGDPRFRRPTFFETVTALALEYFREQQVEVVVWETGLGGRLDATNVVRPLASVITNIAFDHTQYLGETLPRIAGEKCGIIKPGVPVVTAAADPEPLAVIRQMAAENRSPLKIVGQEICAERLSEDENEQQLRLTGCRTDYGVLSVPLLGRASDDELRDHRGGVGGVRAGNRSGGCAPWDGPDPMAGTVSNCRPPTARCVGRRPQWRCRRAPGVDIAGTFRRPADGADPRGAARQEL